MELNFNSVETIANLNASAAFQVDSGKVFKDDVDICPVIIDKKLSYIPWGGDNNLPYHILDLIESDETLSTCKQFNAEVCYGSGLRYNVDESTKTVKQEVEDFLLDNAVAQYWLGVCHDFKRFAFCVSVIILNVKGNKVMRLIRKEACYCRLSPAEKDDLFATEPLFVSIVAPFQSLLSKKKQLVTCVANCFQCSGTGSRTPVSGVRGQRPRPLDDTTISRRGC